ncbi:MAG TPA: class I SAM-dependent methyltransferase [Desulfomonilia bacterium]|nr:class I SAM-dependent methyltransferase [Desulfomonilia bacterium]
MQELFSYEDIRKTYEQVDWHRRCKDIIQEYALNALDIRDAALDGLDLTEVREVLDLGCGYGFFTERLSGRLNSGAHITGIDVIEKNNRDNFMNMVNLMGCTGTFIQGSADIIRDMPDNGFDLIVTSYSLYFFPHLIPEIARILRREGVFIAVTHSKHALREVTKFVSAGMKMAGIEPPDDLKIHELFEAFSLEDGAAQLTPYFQDIDRAVYKNSLLFPFNRFHDFLEYINIKKPLFFKEVLEDQPAKMDDVMAAFTKTSYEHARENGKVLITKDDGIFRCRLPIDRRMV